EAPDLSALHNLETIDINDNNLTVFPAVNNTSLKVVIAYDNDFTELPDFSNMLHSVPGSQMVLHNNRLTFEDLLPLTDLEFDVLYISEQKQPDPDRTVTASLHQAFTLVLPYDDEVTSSVYEWYKDGALLTTTNTNRLMLENVSEGDAGVYRARITNANIPDLILESGAVTLITKVMDDLVISPDNDGVLDNYTIPFQGMVKIYNRAGALVNQFAAPALWDGTDSSGNPLPMGVYIMVCPGYKEIAITVIR
ncbi:MAG TPA: gliding motility-associated C-terminal domain-containing protein, partial [Ohtaekwangia sp.]